MAITKIHGIKTTVQKAVNYICNPAKTDGKILVSSFGCSPETAALDFGFSLSKTETQSPNKAFHLIQSFMPDEVSFDEANQIGLELADKLLEGKYSYVVATHTDKGHVHNHIIFCAADNINHEKYHDCKQSYRHIRQLNDRLCSKHNLSVISPSNEKGKSYKEWQAVRDGRSWKKQIMSDIDNAIKSANSYDDFIAIMRQKNYEIKGEMLNDPHSKYISFRAAGKERFVRGSEKTLGKNFTKESIAERIEKNVKQRDERKANRIKNPNYSSRSLIDVTQEKFAQNAGLRRWANLQNLKTASAAYSEAGTLTELEEKIAAKNNAAKSARQNIMETERKLKNLGQILKYAEQYKSNRIYHIHYQKSKDKDRYLRQHETELLLHDGAENMLHRFGVDTKSLNIEKLRSEYSLLYAKKASLQQTFKSAEKEAEMLQRKLDSLTEYIGDIGAEQRATDRTPSQKDKEAR